MVADDDGEPPKKKPNYNRRKGPNAIKKSIKKQEPANKVEKKEDKGLIPILEEPKTEVNLRRKTRRLTD